MRVGKLKIHKITLLAVILALLGTTFTGCGAKTAVVQPDIKNVRAVGATTASIEMDVEYAGKIKPAEEVTVSSKVSGKVSTVSADVGSEVQAGQVLFTLDSKDVDAQYQQSQAALDSARANLTRTSDSSISQQVIQAESAVKQAQIQYDDIKNLYDKTKKLFQAGSATQQQMDDLDTRVKGAQVQLETAQADLSLIKEKAGPQSVDVASAQVTQAQAGVNLASTQLDNDVISSPIAGTVSIRNIEVGELTSSAVAAFTIINTKTLTVEVSIPDSMVEKVRKGQNAPVKISALGEKVFDGIVDSISPSADAKTDAYIVKIKVDNADGSIKPGMFARVVFPTEKKENILTVPNQAIVVESGIQYIYAVVQNAIVKKPIETGLSNDKVTEVTKGLNAGDDVVTEGQSFLNEGEKVNVVK